MHSNPIRRGACLAILSARQALFDPVMLAMAVVEIAFLLIIAFGLHLDLHGNEIVGLSLFGPIVITEIGFLVKALMPGWIQTATYLFILAGIALAATRWTEMLNDPPRSRSF